MLSAISIFGILSFLDSEPSNQKSSLPVLSNRKVTNLEQSRIQPLPAKWVCQDKKIISNNIDSKNKKIGFINNQIQDYKRLAFKNPSEFLIKLNSGEKIENKEAATSAIFEFANMCFKLQLPSNVYRDDQKIKIEKFNSYGCNSLPKDLIKKPLSVLDELARSGSQLGKVLYLSAALDIVPLYRRLGDDESNAYATSAAVKGEMWGKEASEAGYSEANLLLNRAYREGTFGEIDNAKGLAYLISINGENYNREDKALSEYIVKIKGELKPDELKKASMISQGCEPQQSQSGFLQSPF